MANSGELYQNLKKYVRGNIDKYELERSDSSIDRIIENSTKGLTKITFVFKDNDEFFRMLNVGDDDIFMARAVNGGEGYSFIDWYGAQQDFKDGFNVFYDFNSENKEKIKDILDVVDPSFDYEDLLSENPNARAAEIMLKFFERETNNIVEDWTTEMNNGANISATEFINSEINEVLSNDGFELQTKFDVVKIDVGHLLMLYVKNGKPWLSFKKLFSETYKETDSLGRWGEDIYEFLHTSNFDKDSFNYYVDKQLYKIEDRLNDLENLNSFTEMVGRIKKKYKVNTNYDLPKLKGVTFSIKSFDREEMKIVVDLRHKLQHITKKVSEENFYNLLYQPELFDFGFGDV